MFFILRRILVSFSPLKDIQIKSIVERDQAITLKILRAYIINNFTIYQLIYIGVLLLVMTCLFKNKYL